MCCHRKRCYEKPICSTAIGHACRPGFAGRGCGQRPGARCFRFQRHRSGGRQPDCAGQVVVWRGRCAEIGAREGKRRYHHRVHPKLRHVLQFGCGGDCVLARARRVGPCDLYDAGPAPECYGGSGGGTIRTRSRHAGSGVHPSADGVCRAGPRLRSGFERVRHPLFAADVLLLVCLLALLQQLVVSLGVAVIWIRGLFSRWLLLSGRVSR